MRAALAILLLVPSAPLRDGAAVTGRVIAVEGEKQKEIRAAVRYVGAGIEQRKPPDPSPAVVWLEGAPSAAPAPVRLEMKQQGIEFRPRVVAIPVGSTLDFPNLDRCFHNVFSHRTANASRIDLGRYVTGESKPVLFDRPGRTFLRCDIHKHMRGYIHVFGHPYFALAGPDGAFSIPAVPPGRYTLTAWKEDFDEARAEVEVKADGAKVDVTLSWSGEAPGGESAAASAACCEAR
jgi:plastocyanin